MSMFKRRYLLIVLVVFMFWSLVWVAKIVRNDEHVSLSRRHVRDALNRAAHRITQFTQYARDSEKCLDCKPNAKAAGVPSAPEIGVALSAKKSTENNAALTDSASKADRVIAKRIHFVFKDDMVPSMYKAPVQSWLNHHPDWEIWFWTDDLAREFIQDQFPTFRASYDKYKHDLQRSDVIRYFILYKYGGIYTDMDVKSMKNIEPLLKDRHCVISREPPLQTKMIFDKENTLTNSLMACTQGHPFMKHIIAGLDEARKRSEEPGGILLSTGPFFLNQTYNTYIQTFPDCAEPQTKPETLKLDLKPNPQVQLTPDERTICKVSVVDYKYMCPRMDMPMLRLRKKFCADPAKKKTAYQQMACDGLAKMNFRTEGINSESFADHLWYHFGWGSDAEKQRRRKTEFAKITLNRPVQRYQKMPPKS